MKIKTILLIICTLIIYSEINAQKYPFQILKGVKLYSTRPHDLSEIKPYNRESFQVYNSEKTKVIETGNFLYTEKK